SFGSPMCSTLKARRPVCTTCTSAGAGCDSTVTVVADDAFGSMRRKLSLSRGPGKAQILSRPPRPARGPRMNRSRKASTIAIALTCACATHPAQRAPAAPGGRLAATTAPVVRPGPRRVLFAGSTLDAFRGYQKPDIPPGWSIGDGTLAKRTPVDDIMSKEEFDDFELEMDW